MANLQTIGGQQTKRIEYIDAMRGFTMILVVFYHVSIFVFPAHLTRLQYYFWLVRMPLFFFISGFVLYKASVVWNTSQIAKFFRKKIPVQLLSPFIFFLVYAHTTGDSLSYGIHDMDKLGYWFTYILLIYYLFYAGIRFIIRSERIAEIVLVVIGLVMFFINWHVIYDAIPLSDDVKGILSMRNWDRFLFFVLGTLVKKYFAQVEKILDSGWLLTICILFFFLSNAFTTFRPIDPTIIRLFRSLTGLVILFSFFRKYESSFKKDRFIGNSLQYIGRRTLDVYLIHFFLLRCDLTFFTAFIDHNMPVIETVVTLAVALVIVIGCLLIGNIIRLSPFLAHWVFGAKLPQKTKE